MTLQRRLACRYTVIVAVCLVVLGWFSYHELVEEPDLFRRAGVQEPVAGELTEMVEVLLFAGVPLLLTAGWWWMRRSLKPIDDLAAGVERFDAQNLSARLPRSRTGDEVDRMSGAFNAMAARLENSFEQIREFTLHASHELKTPLTVMRAQLETMLAQSPTLPAMHRTALETLLEETQRLARIVDGLTLLTRADAGVIALERQPVAFDELVREAVEDAVVLGQPAGIQIHLIHCEPARVTGDRHRLRQVLLNLMDNAVKYNEAGGRVEVALRPAAGQLQLTVANTGPGIPPALIPHIFERFVRGESARRRAAEGCGLGLTIVKWIVEAHDGQIQIASPPGKLTTVTIALPSAGEARA